MSTHPADVFKHFRAYPFFTGFTDEVLLQVCSMAKTFSFQAGDTILVQGQSNENLIFLCSGSVQIIVDGENVALLSGPGEVLGEMSVISSQPVSATIQANGSVECFSIDSKDFLLINPKDRAHCQYLLFKVFASILTERLRTTNAKARQHEIANRDLIEAQGHLKRINSELESKVQERTRELEEKANQLEKSFAQLENQNFVLLTGFKKASEQVHLRNATFEKIRSLDRDYLQSLPQRLQAVEQQVSEAKLKSDLQGAYVDLNNLAGQMRSLMAFFQSEKALETKRLLLLEPEKKQQLVAKMALGGTGVNLDIAGDVDAAEAHLSTNKYDLVLSDIVFADFLGSLHDKSPSQAIAVMLNNQIAESLSQVRQLPFVTHLMSRDPNDRSATVRIIVTTINKILNQDYLGLEKYLNWGVDVIERKVDNSNQRADRIAEMQANFKKIGVRGSLLERCGTVLEEMLMNAIYDAPTDISGKALFNSLARTKEIQLRPDQSALLRYACDGNLIAVSVRDPFGRLPKKTIFDYLETCYSGAAGTLNTEKGGAGRGLHQIVENSDLTVFNVNSNQYTEVICLFYIDPAYGAGHTGPRLHYFYN